jgi:hypothetical protein
VEMEAFLTSLAVERNVAASTQGQALAALLFLYREELGLEVPQQRDRPPFSAECPQVWRACTGRHRSSPTGRPVAAGCFPLDLQLIADVHPVSPWRRG